MSGFEIAGVVLGAYPILYDAAKDLRGIFQDVRAWWRFEREFEDFIQDIEKEHIAFSQILDILLEPLDELSWEDREALQANSNSALWFDMRIQGMLAQRVQGQYYEWFMIQLNNMDAALEELHQLLPIQKAYYLDSSSLESEMFRIKTSFSHRKNELLSIIRAGNKTLYNFLDREAHIQHARTSTPASWNESAKAVASALKFQEQAKTVFEGFQRHWICSCASAGGHSCGISAHGSHLKLLFDNGTEWKHLKVETKAMGKESGSSEPPNSSQTGTKQADVAVLRRQISVKRTVKKLKEDGPRSIIKLTASTLAALSIPVNMETRGDCNGMERSPEKLKKRHQTEGGIPAPQTSRVRWDSHPQPRIGHPGPVTIPSPGTSRRDQAISDICKAVKTQCPESCLGFLELLDIRLFLHLEPPMQTQLIDVLTVEEFMNSTPRRDSRLKLGLAITTTVLNLGPSWVPENWRKSSLVVLRAPGATPQPYISHQSIHTTLNVASTRSAEKARASLLTLGILLLELLFRDTLERQPFRTAYLGSGGQPNDMTEICMAMRWQKKVEEEFGDRLANAIRSCIYCAFEPPPDLSSSAFVRAVWTMVARPIEEFLRAYSSGTYSPRSQ